VIKVAFKYFKAAQSEILPAFPGWRVPLPSPERRHLHNPFTREPMFNGDGTPLMTTTTRPLGAWTERPQCPRLSAFDPVDLWPISSMEVGVLGKALGAPAPSEPSDALYAPESWGWSLRILPEPVVRTFAQTPAVDEAVAAWHRALEEMYDEDHFVQLDADVSDWVATLDRLFRLSRSALDQRQHMFVYEGIDPEFALDLPPGFRVEPGSLE